MSKLSGGCLCGDVRYETESEMLMAYRCHCRDCQKASGTGHLSVFAVPAVTLDITGELTFYDKKGDSGNSTRFGFCPKCGSTVLGKPESSPEVVALTAGSLDDPNQYKPTMDIYTESATSWDSLEQDTVKLPRMF